MESMWMFGGEKGPQCWIDAVPSSTRIGLGTLDLPSGYVSILPMFYPAPTLITMVRIARYMNQAKLEPIAHLWELETQKPECAVKFEIPNPPESLLEETGVMSKENPVGRELGQFGCKRLCAVSASNGDREAVQQFLTQFREVGIGAVLIGRKEDEDNERFDPVAKLILTKVTTEPFIPDFE